MSTRNRFYDIDYSFTITTSIYDFRSQQLVSLEEALKPIESQIDRLSHFINVAKRRCHYPSEHGLTHDESASIYIYTMEWNQRILYRLLNQALRNEDRQIVKIWFPYLKLFHCALNKLPIVKGNIWRGIPGDIGKYLIENQLVTQWSINSCSSSFNVTKDFLKNNPKSTLFLIKALNGKKVSGYNEYENEDEVIFKMGTKFRVKSIVFDHRNGSYVVNLVEIDVYSLKNSIKHIKSNIKFQEQGTIVAGGNGGGSQFNQLSYSYGTFVDKNQTIFVADWGNHRIVKWKRNAKQGKIIAGGNGQGKRIDQLNGPTDVIVDYQHHSIIIVDYGNRRLIRWSRDDKKQEILIENIDCCRLAMDEYGFLYVSNWKKNEVRKWNLEKIYENKKGMLVAGGNGEGNELYQLHCPSFIFVDKDQSVYISDQRNYRVMKWRKDAREGIVVAGGNGKGKNLNQLNWPEGLFVDQQGQIYVVDYWNDRIMRWCEGDGKGSIIVGRNGSKSNQLNGPRGLSLGLDGSLYISDSENHRIIRFDQIR